MNQIARSCTCPNLFFISKANESVEGASIKDNTPTSTSMVSSKAFTPIFTFIPGSLSKYTNVNLQKATKLALESFI